MVDASKLKPGDKVVFSGNGGMPGQEYIDEFLSASGKQEPIASGTVFTVADPVASNCGRHYVMLETPLGKNGAIECSAYFLNYVDPVNVVHDMRNAGPPAPAACSCDIVSLMRVGCRCGHLQCEREAAL